MAFINPKAAICALIALILIQTGLALWIAVKWYVGMPLVIVGLLNILVASIYQLYMWEKRDNALEEI
jgi:hypothetical protein